LRANDIDTLVLFGIAPGGVVLSTTLHAVDLDYRVIVVKDCCADDDEDVRACVLDKVLARFGTVASAAGVSRAFGRRVQNGEQR
jgi:nicotinamidase-related amidase